VEVLALSSRKKIIVYLFPKEYEKVQLFRQHYSKMTRVDISNSEAVRRLLVPTFEKNPQIFELKVEGADNLIPKSETELNEERTKIEEAEAYLKTVNEEWDKRKNDLKWKRRTYSFIKNSPEYAQHPLGQKLLLKFEKAEHVH